MPSANTLAQLPVGSGATIQSIAIGRSGLTRLRELGLVPGTRVSVIRRGALGGPIEISVRGSNLALRSHEAQHILLTADAATADSKSVA